MYFLDSKDELNDFLLDPNRKIPKTHLSSVCKLRQGKDTCRYIFLSEIGYICMKKSPAKKNLDRLVIQEKLSARGDNCEGLGAPI